MHVPRRRLLVLASFVGCVGGASGGCSDAPLETSYPQAEAFPRASDFSGMWMGEVRSTSGVLEITALGAGRYRGVFRAEDDSLRYILALDQTKRDEQLANLVRYTWQDGRGGRGHGWLLINREDSALTGAFGEGENTAGLGEWSFIRLE